MNFYEGSDHMNEQERQRQIIEQAQKAEQVKVVPVTSQKTP